MLEKHGISTIIHYPIPVHLQVSYRECCQQGKYLPITEKLAGEIISLPLYPELTDKEVKYIIQSVIQVYEQLK